ncbi:MAG: hypothetical protein KGL36_12090 [Gammaproteobacteria bacterium]|nr:hypothetical protein [Gammaproteobacteria bacterium]
MRPLTVLFGILLGTCVSATFTLAALALIWAVVAHSDPRLATGIPHRPGAIVASFSSTALASLSFIGQLRSRPWRGLAHLATAAAIGVGVLWFSIHG